MEDDRPRTRKTGKHLRVPVLPAEEELITRNATAAGLPVASFLRSVGMGWEIRGVVDTVQVDALLKINADLGRLGGLLKLWLSDDPRTRDFSPAVIRAVLSKIEDTQEAMRAKIREVVRPRANRRNL